MSLTLRKPIQFDIPTIIPTTISTTTPNQLDTTQDRDGCSPSIGTASPWKVEGWLPGCWARRSLTAILDWISNLTASTLCRFPSALLSVSFSRQLIVSKSALPLQASCPWPRLTEQIPRRALCHEEQHLLTLPTKSEALFLNRLLDRSHLPAPAERRSEVSRPFSWWMPWCPSDGGGVAQFASFWRSEACRPLGGWMLTHVAGSTKLFPRGLCFRGTRIHGWLVHLPLVASCCGPVCEARCASGRGSWGDGIVAICQSSVAFIAELGAAYPFRSTLKCTMTPRTWGLDWWLFSTCATEHSSAIIVTLLQFRQVRGSVVARAYDNLVLFDRVALVETPTERIFTFRRLFWILLTGHDASAVTVSLLLVARRDVQLSVWGSNICCFFGDGGRYSVCQTLCFVMLDDSRCQDLVI